MPDDTVATEESITENIDAWWEYATEEHNDPTIEDRLSILEDVVAMMMEG